MLRFGEEQAVTRKYDWPTDWGLMVTLKGNQQAVPLLCGEGKPMRAILIEILYQPLIKCIVC